MLSREEKEKVVAELKSLITQMEAELKTLRDAVKILWPSLNHLQ